MDEHWDPAWQAEWQRHYAALRELLTDEDDHSDVLPGFTVHGMDIGKWLARQRQHTVWARLMEGQRELLEAVGVVPPPPEQAEPAKAPRGPVRHVRPSLGHVSLGCVLYAMVTGQRPFTGTSWRLVNQHLNEEPAPLRTVRPDAPAELERFTGRLMAKDPAQRPASGEVWAALKEINNRYFGSTPPSRGKDLAHDIDVTPAEATDGAIIPLRITAHKPCPACTTRTDEKAARSCTTCEGEGRLIQEQHTYKVRIPAGIRDGQKVRIRELGGPGKHGGAPGDLYVTVHVTD